MFKVEIEIDGKRVRSDEITDSLQRMAMQKVVEVAKKKAGAIQCPVHHRAATLTLTGRQGDELTFHITGCCDELVQKVTAALSH